MSATLESVGTESDHFEAQFRTSPRSGRLRFSGCVREGILSGEVQWGDIDWTPALGLEVRLPKLTDAPDDGWLPRADLAASGIDTAALDTLLEHGREEKSSAIVILKDGRVLVEEYRTGYGGSPLTAMSASKSVVSIAVGMLIADGKLSESARMDGLFPDWVGLGPKSGITIRQLLSQTSGLDPSRRNTSETIPAHARSAPLGSAPGTRWQYNNDAVDLLAAAFQQASGEGLDAYLDTRLFRKLGVRGAFWMKDPEGTPLGAGELVIRPKDLAKLGQLMLDGGSWRGEQLLPAAWVRRSVEASQPFEEDYGLLWWREGSFTPVLTEAVLETWRDIGLDEGALRGARSLLGKPFPGQAEYGAAITDAIGDAAAKKLASAIQGGNHVPYYGTVSSGPARGFSARGWLGQWLVVLPAAGVVAVRMRASERADYDGTKVERYAYTSFANDVARLF